uniref:[histone H3]-lysine(4) N-methyltransferase n=1 Tax=Cyprinus carpio TaxID=7962 RepID=A0A8C1NM41_CYPCA
MGSTGSQDPQNDSGSVQQLHSQESLKDTSVDDGGGGGDGGSEKCTRSKRGSTKQETQSAPRITIKLVAKKKVVTLPSVQRKSGKKQKEIKSEVTESQCAQISSAHVKLKTNVAASECSAGEAKEEVCTRRRGRSADKKSESTPQTNTEKDASEQKLKLRKSTRRSQNPLPSESIKPKPDEKSAQKASEVNKLVFRKQRRRSSNVPQESGDQSLAESLLEGSTVDESRLPSKKKKDKKKKKKKNRKESERKREPHSPSSKDLGPSADDPQKLAFDNDFVGIPGLRLTRIRNPKARSRKKRCKFVWTLTLVKSKSKDSQIQENLSNPQESKSKDSQVQDDLCKTQEIKSQDSQIQESPSKVDESPNTEAELPARCDQEVDVSTEAESTSTPSNILEIGSSQESQSVENTVSAVIPESTESPVAVDKVEETPEKESEEVLERSVIAAEAHPEEATQTDPEELISKDTIPPLQIKVVSSPGKKNSLKQSFLIQQVTASPGRKEPTNIEDPQHSEKSENALEITAATPAPKVRKRLRQNTARKKRAKHKHWTIYRRKCKLNAPQENLASETATETESQVEESPVSPTAVPAPVKSKPNRHSSEVTHKKGKRSVPPTTEPLPEVAEPQVIKQTVESPPTSPFLGSEPQPEIKLETPSIETEEVLVLEPSVKDHPQVLRPSRRRMKRVKRRRKSLIGRRIKNSKLQKELFEVSEACPPMTGSEVEEPKLFGIFSTKYKRKRISSLQSLEGRRKKAKLLSKQLGNTNGDQLSDQTEMDSVIVKTDQDQDIQQSKTKFMKTIRHFIMPVVSARSSRVIKTPKRFMDDLGMSDLPRKNSQKKLGLQPKSKKCDSSEKDEPESLQSKDEDNSLSEADLDLSSTWESKPKSPDDAELFSEEKQSGKRRSLLRDPGTTCFFSFSDFDEMHHAESEGPVSVDTLKHATDVEEKTATQRPRLTGANKRMFNLLKKAKVQLIKIDQQKQLKSSGVSHETESVPFLTKEQFFQLRLEPARGGPRIKHVCRAAAVVLGQPRAMVPDDIPRLSALPLHERSDISPSPAEKGTSRVESHSDPESPVLQEHRTPKFRRGRAHLYGNRSRRCGECKGCLHEEDCGRCINCLDKPKFGGPNTKRQCCSPQEQTPPSVLAALANGFAEREQEPAEPTHKIRVDFKEDCSVQSVWETGGLSILTSVPLMPQYVCLLCASKGQHEMLYCQVCCEPFHRFCLDPSERPLEENKENWCCRRCKFCRVCGCKNKESKPLLECERCQNFYHPACLGPYYPKPNKRKKPWVCMTCIRCKSCGVTPGKSWDTEWNHDKGLCPDCTRLFDQGNYCTMCFKCYEDNDYDSQMMQCSTCNHWVHAKCEGLTDDLYEILSSLPESVVYSCQPCLQELPDGEDVNGAVWRELLDQELKTGLERVLSCLLSSSFTKHLVTCKKVGIQSLLNKTKYAVFFFLNGMLSHAVMPPNYEHVYAQWRERAGCQKALDADAGRLLYLGQNEWAHVNCTMWSAEVFEEDNGSLLHVHSAVARGRLMRCERCNRTGATVGCCLTSCQSNYHFMCARFRNCVFQDDKRVFCHKHRDLISGKIITGQGFEVLRRVYVDFEGISFRRKFLTGLEPESINLMIGSLLVKKLGKLSELSACNGKLFPVGYECFRWYWSTVNPLHRCKYTFRVREVQPTVQEKPVEESPDQGENCTIAHSPCPQSESEAPGVDLSSTYPSTETNFTSVSVFAKPDLGARPKIPLYPQNRRPAGGLSRPLPSPGNSFLLGMLSCSDDEMPPSDGEEHSPPSRDQPHLRFEITSDDGFSVEADNVEVAWSAVIEGVQEARAVAGLRQLTFSGMSGARVMGMLYDAIVYLVEQLQGANRCQRHTFRFHKQASQEEDLPVNPSGCARSEVYLRSSTFDMFNFLASQHRQLPDTDLYDEEEDEVLLKSTRRATSLELPMAMRFRHLEKTSKEAVGVYRSAIHGRGLFCKRNIEAGEMVIEYSGIVIRSVLTDKREKYYDGKGIGCYMFRIDDFDVVDATMHGNAARFINHSCEPNCYSRVINVEGQKHIVIFALRKIYRGEELTYDYKFPIEDASNKLGCNCGAKRCRRFLN